MRLIQKKKIAKKLEVHYPIRSRAKRAENHRAFPNFLPVVYILFYF